MSSLSSSSCSSVGTNRRPTEIKILISLMTSINVVELILLISPFLFPGLFSDKYLSVPCLFALFITVFYWVVAEGLVRDKRGQTNTSSSPEDNFTTKRNMISVLIIQGLPVAIYIINGCQYRSIIPYPIYCHSSIYSPFVSIPCLLCIFANILRFVAMYTLKSQFTATLTIHSDHKIIDNGVYSYIRHPGYAANGLLFLSTALLLTGDIFILLCLGSVFAYAWNKRIQAEEKMLLDNLKGYRDYMNKVKFRLIPHIY